MPERPKHVTGHDDHISDELLSAYLDGDVEDEATLELIDVHLAQCGVCREALGELRALVRLLGELPEPAVPRSFALTPEMVRSANVVDGPWFVRFQPALRWATAAAAALLVLVLGADLLLHQPGGSDSAPAEIQIMAGSAEVSPEAAADTASAGTTQESAGTSADQASPEAALRVAPADEAPTAPPGVAGTNAEPATPPEPAADARSAANDGQEHGFEQPAAEPIAEAPSTAGAPSGWRLAEAALALVVVWLLIATIGLPRLRQRRG